MLLLGLAAGKAGAASPDALLEKSLSDLSHSHVGAALDDIDRLLATVPNFRLAQLIKGDLLLSRSRPISAFGNVPGASHEKLAELKDEAVARMARYQGRPTDDVIPRYLLEMRSEQKYAIVVDLSTSALYLYRNQDGEPHLVADYYVTSGLKEGEKNHEGDKKTPIGVYYVTGKLPRATLGDFYGSGAYPISYPNEMDRREGRGGHGIWLHGTPSDTYSRAPKASSGCVVLSNHDLDEVAEKLQIGLTPVIISNKIEWVGRAEEKNMQESLHEALEKWRQDWESLNTSSYLTHYSPKFMAGGEDYAGWSRHKMQVNSGKTWVKVKISNISAFQYPANDNLFVVSFDQDYQSSNLENRMHKKQYWLRDNSGWKIIYEGEAG